MTLVDRIKTRCKEKHTSMNALEGELGFGNGTLRRWDERTPGADRLLILANRLDVSVDWLLTGKETPELTSEEIKLIDYYRAADDKSRSMIMTLAAAGAAQDNSEPEPADSSTSKIG